MGNYFGSIGLDTEGYNKEIGEIGDYTFGMQIQSRTNEHGKPLEM